MTGTTAQPSHEPPHERKGTDTRHTENISREKTTKPRGKRGIGGGGEKVAGTTQHEGNSL